MIKIKKTIATIMFGIMIFATTNVYATASSQAEEKTKVNSPDETTILDVEVGVDKTLTIPLTLDAKKKEFYFCTNISPGDKMKATVIFKNPRNEEAQVSVSDVINQLENNKKAVMLLDILDLTINVNNAPMYKGPDSQVTTPVTGWVPVAPKGEAKMDLIIEVPKTADNTYQNADMNIKWVFEARSDVPPDPVDPTPAPGTPGNPSEGTPVKTGDYLKDNYMLIILGGAAIAATLGGVIVYKSKKKNINK